MCNLGPPEYQHVSVKYKSLFCPVTPTLPEGKIFRIEINVWLGWGGTKEENRIKTDERGGVGEDGIGQDSVTKHAVLFCCKIKISWSYGQCSQQMIQMKCAQCWRQQPCRAFLPPFQIPSRSQNNIESVSVAVRMCIYSMLPSGWVKHPKFARITYFLLILCPLF